MQVSDARLAANRLNALKSCGPKTPEGKERSRQNSLKHGLSGQGVVVVEGDQDEIERRVAAFHEDMKPRSPSGEILIRQMATLSVRAERAAEQETAETAIRVRHAAESFDEEQITKANELFNNLADDSRATLRKLRKFPEGVDRLIDAWRDLRDDLVIDPEPIWTEEHLERSGHLTGLKSRHARGSRLGALSKGFWGDFSALPDMNQDLSNDARRAWVRLQLVERIDSEIAELEAHYESLDFETYAADRAEAGARALFDPSKAATLARRYESEARRGFFKALKEFRLVEAESEALAEVAPPPSSTSPMGSSRETPPPPPREPYRNHPGMPMSDVPAVNQPSRAVPAPKTTG